MIFTPVKSDISLFRHVLAFLSIAMLITFAGCQSSGQAYDAEEGAADENAGVTADTTQVDTTAVAAVDSTAMQPVPMSEAERLQTQMRKEMEDLKTENIALRQKGAALEKKNRELMVKVSDLEAAQSTSQDQLARTKAAPVAPPRRLVAEKATAAQIAQYEKAVALAKRNKFQDCFVKMQAVLDGGLGADYVGNAHFWIGLCHFSMHDYEAAADQFKEVLNQPVSKKKEAAQYMLWKTRRKEGNFGAAQAEARRLLDEFPNSQYAGEVRAAK